MDRSRKRLIASGIAVFSAVVAFATLSAGWRDYELAAELRDRGVLAEGQFVGTDIVRSRERTSPGSRGGSSYETVEREYRLWSYRAGGRAYLIRDRGENFAGNMATDRLGPPQPGQIVYLPEAPGKGHLRTQIGVDYPALFTMGGFALLVALVSGTIALFVLKPTAEEKGY